MQFTKNFIQKIQGSKEQIFPLLCPVRERDWLEHWDCEILHSDSGFNEEGCVFTTTHHSDKLTVWVTSKYNIDSGEIQFVRITEGEESVKIDIKLEELTDYTECVISYQYTPLTQERSDYLNSRLDDEFISSMHWWERALNHYLKTGKILSQNN